MKIKVTFVLGGLSAGGAERVISYIAQNLNPAKFKVQLLITGSKSNTVYSVNGIDIIYLEKKRALHAIPELILFLLKYRPNIVMSSIGHLNIIIGLISPLFPKIKFIVRHTNLYSNNSFFNKSYTLVDMIICQSQDMANMLSKNSKVENNKIVIIGNPITNEIEIPKELNNLTQTNRYITIGRLSSIKGHVRILRILAKLNKNFHYTIIGDGPERENILRQIRELGLESQITHIPFTNKINDYLLDNDLFLQGSYSEGFPNALLESCVVGTPVIAFEAPGGTSEIIENGINGFIVKNEEEFLYKLNNLTPFDPQNVSESVYKKFAKEIILKEYESFFQKIIDER